MKFSESVNHIVRQVPKGKVATYGQIAAVLGHPRSARMVGIVLAKNRSKDVPWQRIINRHGMISIENMAITKDDQARLLREEGVEVIEKDGNLFIPLDKYLVDSALLMQSHE